MVLHLIDDMIPSEMGGFPLSFETELWLAENHVWILGNGRATVSAAFHFFGIFFALNLHMVGVGPSFQDYIIGPLAIN